jgi:hypothetical protein
MAEQPRPGDELARMEHEPFLDAEKKLVAWSLVAGIVLLGVLIWLSYAFFPVH